MIIGIREENFNDEILDIDMNSNEIEIKNSLERQITIKCFVRKEILEREFNAPTTEPDLTEGNLLIVNTEDTT